MSRDVVEIVARIAFWTLLCTWLAWSIVQSYRLNKQTPEASDQDGES